MLNSTHTINHVSLQCEQSPRSQTENCNSVYHFTIRQVMDSPKSKETTCYSGRIEIIVVKGEIAQFEQFSPFP